MNNSLKTAKKGFKVKNHPDKIEGEFSVQIAECQKKMNQIQQQNSQVQVEFKALEKWLDALDSQSRISPPNSTDKLVTDRDKSVHINDVSFLMDQSDIGEDLNDKEAGTSYHRLNKRYSDQLAHQNKSII